jgi:hypothetical protein
MESEYIRRTGQLIEYIKLHRISLIQDNENQIQDSSDPDWNFLQGQIIATEHLLSVATDILGVELKEK